jgi:hypothetical protein
VEAGLIQLAGRRRVVTWLWLKVWLKVKIKLQVNLCFSNMAF